MSKFQSANTLPDWRDDATERELTDALKGLRTAAREYRDANPVDGLAELHLRMADLDLELALRKIDRLLGPVNHKPTV